MKENIVLSDSRAEELKGFMQTLNCKCKKKFIIKVNVADLTLKGKLKEVRRYLAYFVVPFIYFVNRKKYNIIVGWQQFYALIFCYYCNIFHVKKTNFVIAWNFTYKEKKGKFSKIYRAFFKKCIDGGFLDLIHVPSIQYANDFCEKFKFPKEKVIVAPFGIVDNYMKYKDIECPSEISGKDYFIAIGRSNRDYEFLVKSWDNDECILVIASDNYSSKIKNENIILKKDITAENQYQWISNAKGVIIPLDNPTICSGDTVLLTAMSLKKPVIVTAPSTLAEMYIRNEKNGILISKEKEELSNAVKNILKSNYNELGENARKSFLENYTRDKMGEVLADKVNKIIINEQMQKNVQK